jgi:hypothetical protein
MQTTVDSLLNQISYAQWIGRLILEASDISLEGVVYVFATAETLVINCKDYAAAWRFDEDHLRIQEAIAQLKIPIQAIHGERAGQPFYSW